LESMWKLMWSKYHCLSIGDVHYNVCCWKSKVEKKTKNIQGKLLHVNQIFLCKIIFKCKQFSNARSFIMEEVFFNIKNV
jgi:hypothetical protein